MGPEEFAAHLSCVGGKGASPWRSGLEGRASGPGTAAAKHPRHFPSSQRSPAPRLLSSPSPPSPHARLERLRILSQAWWEDLLARAPQIPRKPGAKSPEAALGPRTQHPSPHLDLLLPAPSPALACGSRRPRPLVGASDCSSEETPPTPRRGGRNPAGLRSPALPLVERTASHSLPPLPLASRTAICRLGWAAGF